MATKKKESYKYKHLVGLRLKEAQFELLNKRSEENGRTLSGEARFLVSQALNDKPKAGEG